MKNAMYILLVVVVALSVSAVMMVPGCSNTTSDSSIDTTVVDSAALVDSTALTGDSTTAKIDTGVSAN